MPSQDRLTVRWRLALLDRMSVEAELVGRGHASR